MNTIGRFIFGRPDGEVEIYRLHDSESDEFIDLIGEGEKFAKDLQAKEDEKERKAEEAKHNQAKERKIAEEKALLAELKEKYE